jgi:ribonuclease BN (tRNA processing enzyme)
MGLSFTVLGCSGSYPGRGQACSGYLVQGGGVNLLIDLGPGSLANLQFHLELSAIDAVILTHRHPDHWTDLTGLEVAWQYGLHREGLPVYGTAETHRLAEVLASGLSPTMVWHDIVDKSVIEIGRLRCHFVRTDHYVETLAVRVDDLDSGQSLAYSADTGPSWSFSSLGDGIDLALCEATNLASEEGPGILHLSARQAGAMTRSAGVPRLVLTHIWPGGDPEAYRAEAVEAFGGPVEIAITNERYDL